MFILHEITDCIRTPPENFGGERIASLTVLIDRKYGNRVVPKVGLCICVYDFVSIGDSYVYPGDGAAHTDCTFKMIVFQPFIGEVIEGRTTLCTKALIRVSTEFFDDIYIEPSGLPLISKFVDDGGYWQWTYSDGTTDPEANQDEEEESGYYIQQNQRVRLKVENIIYRPNYVEENKEFENDTSRQRSNSIVSTGSNYAAASTNRGPMVIIGSFKIDGQINQGLGPVEWWDEIQGDMNGVEDEGGEEEEGEGENGTYDGDEQEEEQ